MLMLPAQIDALAKPAGKLFHRGKGAVDGDAATALRPDAARNHRTVFRKALANEAPFNLRLFAALANKRSAGALAHQNLQGVQQGRFARTGFTGYHRKRRARRKRGLAYQRYIANMHFIDHGNPFCA